jgi:hypothetical protein
VLWCATLLLLVLTFLTMFSLGPFMVPASILAIGSSVLAVRRRAAPVAEAL